MSCDFCELYETVKHPRIMGRGNAVSCDVMFVQDWPNDTDDTYGKQFYGGVMNWLRDELKERGMTSCYYTSLVKCFNPNDTLPNKLMVSCLPYLQKEIEIVDPKVIVPIGKYSCKYFLGKNTLNSLRGQAVEIDVQGKERIILPTLDPRNIQRTPAYQSFILSDLDSLKSVVENGMPKVISVKYRSLNSLQEVRDEITRMLKEAKIICFDTETTGLDAFQRTSKVLCISLTDKTHYGVVIPLQHHESPFQGKDLEEVINLVKSLMESDIPKTAHNGKFDIKWLKNVLGIEVKNFSFDSMLAHYLAISEERGTQGLKRQAWEYTDMGGYDNALDAIVKSLPEAIRYNYDNIPWDTLSTYAVADVDCCLRLTEIYSKLIDENSQWKTLMERVLIPGSVTLADIESNGILLDINRTNAYKENYQKEAERLNKLLVSFPDVIAMEMEKQSLWAERLEIGKIPAKQRTEEQKQKFRDYKKYENFHINWGSINQLRELLFDRMRLVSDILTDKGALSTGEEALKQMSKQSDLPKILLDLRKINTLSNMFVNKLPTMVDSKNFIHGSYNLTGTVTGRLASEYPNMQQVPRPTEDVMSFQYYNEIKSLFISRFGENGCILNADFCFIPDTKVALINGEIDSIENICKRLSSGEQLYTYSINPKTEKTEVSRIIAGRKTSRQKTLKITLDTGEEIHCSYDHRFLTRQGEYRKAKDLKPNDSLMPFVSREVTTDYGATYRIINTGKNYVPDEPEHRLVYSYFHPDTDISNKPIHYKDGNSLNNSSENLECISPSEHWRHHKDFIKKLTTERQVSYGERFSEEIKFKKSQLVRKGEVKKLADRILGENKELSKVVWEQERTRYVPHWEVSVPYLLDLGYIFSHKVKSIEEDNEVSDLYDIQVEKFSNFPLATGVFVHNCALELRIAAIISGDPSMQQAFKDGADLHKITASKVFFVPIEEVTKTQRTNAKHVGFGILYGKSAITFAQDLFYDSTGKDPNKTPDWESAKERGEALVNNYLNVAFPKLGEWIRNTKRFAHQHGYVQTMFGRRRRLPNLSSQVRSLRFDAERQCINAPIQGTGTDLTVLSLIKINKTLKERGMKSLIVITVHDSIVFDVYIPELPQVASLVKYVMEHVHEEFIDTTCPINVDLELGDSYGNDFGVSLEECRKINTVEKFRDWMAIQEQTKFEKEVEQYHKLGFDVKTAIQYLIAHGRPMQKLTDKIKEVYAECEKF